MLWLAIAGVVLSWFFYMKRPDIPEAIKQRFSGVYKLLENKYHRMTSTVQCSQGCAPDRRRSVEGRRRGLIDGPVVNGSARVVASFAAASRYLQSGYIYHYAFAMIVGMLVLLTLTITGVIGTK